MKFVLPELPYDFDALAPYISAETLELHYGKHHRGYLTKLEKEIGGSPLADESLEDIIRSSEGKVFNFAAQVWNHTFYWRSMAPSGGGQPGGSLLDAVKKELGGVDALRESLADAATGEFGSGWAWLVYCSDRSLAVTSSSDADNPLRRGHSPLLTIDVWEHAYYLDYRNERGRYVDALLDHLVNWGFAEENFERAASS